MSDDTRNIDPALWTLRRVFGPAGGPDEVVLTGAGQICAFSFGAQVRRGGPAEALLALTMVPGGKAYLSYLCQHTGAARYELTDLGIRFDQIVWGFLRYREYVESFRDEHGGGVCMTESGRVAASRGLAECSILLERCRRKYLEGREDGGVGDRIGTPGDNADMDVDE